jgi:hypothetical protein
MKTNKILLITLVILASISCRNSRPVHKKPIIYIYNELSEKISVSVLYKGDLTTSYPDLTNNWLVTADKNGVITNLKNGRKHPYLYYEGYANHRVNSIDSGYFIKTDTITQFLENKLDEIGFNFKESTDFITFWLPELKSKKYTVIKFLFNEECDVYSKLEIYPKPDSQIRLMMEFMSIDHKTSIKPQKTIKFDRKPYTVVEWGGINYTSHNEI